MKKLCLVSLRAQFKELCYFNVHKWLPLYTENVFTDLHADDTTIYQISNSQHFIEQNLQAALEKPSRWCKHNGMLLSTDKTKVMLITTSQKRTRLHDYV